MKVIRVVLDDQTLARMQVIAAERFNQVGIGDAERDRQLEELADAAVSEAALEAFRHRKDDPARRIGGSHGQR